MKKWFIKRPDGTVTLAMCDSNPAAFLDEGWSVLENQDQEVPTAHRDTWKIAEDGTVYADTQLAMNKKIAEVRRLRDAMLKKSDEKWVELKSKGMDAAAIEADKAILRDLPDSVEITLSGMVSVEDIEAHDAFAALALSTSYE